MGADGLESGAGGFRFGTKEWGPKLMKSDAELMSTVFRSREKEENIFFQISHYVRKVLIMKTTK